MNYEKLFQSFPGAVTVCDREGVILAMNEKARETFAADGGERLLGTSVLLCHPEPARTKLKEMLAEGRPNIYTIEKAGLKKLIYQAPWTEDGAYRGFLELTLVIPEKMPHFIRGASGGAE